MVVIVAAIAIPLALARDPEFRDGLAVYWGFIGLAVAWFTAALLLGHIIRR